MQPRITGLIDSELGDWRAQTYGVVNPLTTAVYTVVRIGTNWWYTKAFNAGNNSITLFVGPWIDSITATTMMNATKITDGF
jgi:hypothetical protein